MKNRTRIKIRFVYFAAASAALALAIGAPAAASRKGPKPGSSSKAQETSFDDVVVQGKYQASSEPVTTVEDDKAMDALLAPPAHFKDRLKQSAAQDL